MRSLLLLSFIILGITASAKTYYISNSGNDANTGTDPSTPWQTINKLNSVSLSPGDNVLFNCGDTFYGSIIISNSGSSGDPITYGSYGTGANPVITGFTTVTSWTNLGGNIWGSTSAISSLSYCNMVSVNGVNTGMGRYPNNGYLTYQSYSGNTSITSSSLTGSPNWTGASVVIKKLRYVISVGSITAQSGGTLTYTDDALYTPSDNFGLFIQNDIRTLDTANEWYYNSTTGKIDIYSASSPTNVQVATVQNLMVAASGVSYISVMNISFIGSNSDALNFNNNNDNNNITVENCSISYVGIDGISAGGSYTNIENNTLTNINNTAINLSANCSNASVINNTLKKVGLIPGMTQTYSIGSISAIGPNSLIEYNNIDSSGYCGIRFRGLNTIVNNNFVNHSCLIKDDGGGIYTWGTETGRQIIGNIVLNSIGNSVGTDQPNNFLAHGIQLDGGTEFVTISGNTLSGCQGAGIFVQQATNIIIKGNTAYNNGIAGNFMKGAIMFQATASGPIQNVTLKNNIFFAQTLHQLALFYYTSSTNPSDILQFGTTDSNYYARPLDGDSIFLTETGLGSNYYNLTTWKSYIGQDAHSNGSPKSITSPDSLLFEYNASTSSTKIPLNANYIDVTGKSYNGTITLAPYTSAVLIKNGPASNAAQSTWTASAGSNQTITLPVNTTTLTASSSNSSTYISSYVWTKTSGPSGGLVTNYSLKTITLTGLVQGVYNYQVVITDNTGVSSTANVSVTVNAALASATNLGANASDSMNINNGTDSILSVIAANSSLSLNEIQMSNLLKVYPNPVANVTTLELNIPVPNADVMMTITDMNGSTVYKKKINPGFGLVSEQIDMSRFQEGVYVLTVILNGQVIKSLKVVKLATN